MKKALTVIVCMVLYVSGLTAQNHSAASVDAVEQYKAAKRQVLMNARDGSLVVVKPEVYDPARYREESFLDEYGQRRPYASQEEDPSWQIEKIIVRFNGFTISMRWASECKVSQMAGLRTMLNQLSSKPFAVVVNDIARLADRLHLSDWSTLQLVRSVTQSVYGSASCPEAVASQAFMMRSLGFRIGLGAGDDGKMYLLPSFDARVRGMREYYDDGIPFNLMSGQVNSMKELLFFNQSDLAPVSLRLNVEERFYPHYSDTVKYSSSAISVSVPVNSTLKEYYRNYPSYYAGDNQLLEFYNRANLLMARDIKENVYPSLISAVNGKTYVEALDILLDFVQTAFDYQMDGDTWKDDRYFFPGEIWYYGTSDCDDKAILFSRLVRDILGLKVALVYWPGHLSCAVHLDDMEKGYNFDVSGVKYMSCDPTSPGARAGDVMEMFEDVKASLILL